MVTAVVTIVICMTTVTAGRYRDNWISSQMQSYIIIVITFIKSSSLMAADECTMAAHICHVVFTSSDVTTLRTDSSTTFCQYFAKGLAMCYSARCIGSCLRRSSKEHYYIL